MEPLVTRKYLFAIGCAVGAAWLFVLSVPVLLAETRYTVNGQPVSSSTYHAARLVQQSLSTMKNNKPKEAVAQLQSALAMDPTLVEGRVMLGVALARLGRTDEAAEQFQMAVQRKPDLLPARLDLAALYQSTGKLSESLKLYDEVIKDFPESKQLPAIKERADLLRQEVARENDAATQDADSAYDNQSFYANVIPQGRKRWPESQMPLKVYIIQGDGLNGYRPEYDRILRDSFIEWQKKSRGRVKFVFTDKPVGADITCVWVDDPNGLESSAEGGEAEVHTLSQSIVKVRILLSLNDAGSAFPLSDNLVRTLCLHEIGHSLGLIGHSTYADDVMYCTSPIIDREQHLSKRDVNTLQVVYRDDVDLASQLISDLEHQTHGQALVALRLWIFTGTAVLCAVVSLFGVMRAVSKQKKKTRKTRQN